MPRRLLPLLALLALAAGCGSDGAATSSGAAPQNVSLQLDWYPNPDHVGLYTAIDRGFFRRAGLDVTARESLKTAPRGYPKDHPRIDLLRQKGLIAWQEWPVGAWLGTRKAKDRVVGFLDAAAPLRAWLDRHVGDSELEHERR